MASKRLVSLGNEVNKPVPHIRDTGSQPCCPVTELRNQPLQQSSQHIAVKFALIIHTVPIGKHSLNVAIRLDVHYRGRRLAVGSPQTSTGRKCALSTATLIRGWDNTCIFQPVEYLVRNLCVTLRRAVVFGRVAGTLTTL